MNEHITMEKIKGVNAYYITTLKGDIVVNGSIIQEEHLAFIKEQALKKLEQEKDKEIKELKEHLEIVRGNLTEREIEVKRLLEQTKFKKKERK